MAAALVSSFKDVSLHHSLARNTISSKTTAASSSRSRIVVSPQCAALAGRRGALTKRAKPAPSRPSSSSPSAPLKRFTSSPMSMPSKPMTPTPTINSSYPIKSLNLSQTSRKTVTSSAAKPKRIRIGGRALLVSSVKRGAAGAKASGALSGRSSSSSPIKRSFSTASSTPTKTTKKNAASPTMLRSRASSRPLLLSASKSRPALLVAKAKRATPTSASSASSYSRPATEERFSYESLKRAERRVEENSYASSRSYEAPKPAFKSNNGSAYANGSWSPQVATPHQLNNVAYSMAQMGQNAASQVRDLPGGRMLEAAMKEVTTNATEAFRKDLDRSYSFRNNERNLPKSNNFRGSKGMLVVGAGSRTGQIIAEVLGDSRSQVNTLPTTAETFRYEAAKAVVESAETIVWVTEETPDVFSPLAPYQEYEGLLNLLACAQQTGNLKKIVFVSSLGVSNVLLPGNLFFGFFFWKKQAELCLQRSGLDYTIIRPGIPLDSPPTNLVIKAEDSYFSGFVSRQQVADVVAEALNNPAANNAILEVVSRESAPRRSISEMIQSL